MLVVLLAGVIASLQTSSLKLPVPRNFGPYRDILPEIGAELFDQTRDVKIGIKLLIDTAGRPANCRIVDADHHLALANFVCVNMRERAKFRPSADSNGVPTYSYYTHWMRFGFASNERHMATPVDATLTIHNTGEGMRVKSGTFALLVNARGYVETCEAQTNEQTPSLNSQVCAEIRAMPFPVTQDANRNPIVTIRSYAVAFRR